MTRTHRLIGATLGPLLPLAALAGLTPDPGRGPAPLVINESPSLARGLYRHDPGAGFDLGTLVVLPPPVPARAYLARLGVPAEARLLKRVAAGPGDRVCATGSRLTVAGRPVPVLARDGLGRPLPRLSGCRALGPGEVFVLGDTPTSFDSRYFGPVSEGAILGAYRTVLTW
jgi:conjugative transfer signal peptidase TraF